MLASKSPRRKKILSDLGLEFDVIVPVVEETVCDSGSRDTVLYNARIKGEWAASRCPECRIISADTVVDFGGRCIVKPRDYGEAAEFLRMFSGNEQTVFTGVALYVPGAPLDVRVAESAVVFKDLSEDEIQAYIRRVNPMDKAGAYDIDQSGDLLIDHIDGSRTNVMGLPGEMIAEWLGI